MPGTAPEFPQLLLSDRDPTARCRPPLLLPLSQVAAPHLAAVGLPGAPHGPAAPAGPAARVPAGEWGWMGCWGGRCRAAAGRCRAAALTCLLCPALPLSRSANRLTSTAAPFYVLRLQDRDHLEFVVRLRDRLPCRATLVDQLCGSLEGAGFVLQEAPLEEAQEALAAGKLCGTRLLNWGAVLSEAAAAEAATAAAAAAAGGVR